MIAYVLQIHWALVGDSLLEWKEQVKFETHCRSLIGRFSPHRLNVKGIRIEVYSIFTQQSSYRDSLQIGARYRLPIPTY